MASLARRLLDFATLLSRGESSWTGGVNLDIRSDGPEHWTLTVTDSGCGIPADQLENVFQEFHRLPGSEKETGAGLGLAITRQLVNLLGGTIEARSNFGQGSCFWVRLPSGVAG